MTVYIAIDGFSGSGKTYLSEQLAGELGAAVFHLDKYGSDFVPFVGLPVLEEFVKSSRAEVIIYEGVGVFDSRFDVLKPYKIFVDTPKHVREERARARDVPRSDRSAEDWEFIFDVWSKAEKDYAASDVIKKADVIVGSDKGEIDVISLFDSIKAHFK